jgi:quinol-cytochrome oxidoreductase complex cytochrome b subunit
MSGQQFILTEGSDAKKDPVRLLVVQGEARPAVGATEDPMVMTVPHLLVRELIALIGLSLFLALISLLFNAPLEELANPERTPNPAKAPWYFLGLQELLHYYPPVVAGVLLPGAVVFALIVVPYFDVNLRRAPLWEETAAKRLPALLGAVAAFSGLFVLTGAHPVWPIAGPLWVTTACALAARNSHGESRFSRWMRSRSLAFWIFSWFLLAALTLTLIGIFFRGPGWAFTLPWRDGIFY